MKFKFELGRISIYTYFFRVFAVSFFFRFILFYAFHSEAALSFFFCGSMYLCVCVYRLWYVCATACRCDIYCFTNDIRENQPLISQFTHSTRMSPMQCQPRRRKIKQCENYRARHGKQASRQTDEPLECHRHIEYMPTIAHILDLM